MEVAEIPAEMGAGVWVAGCHCCYGFSQLSSQFLNFSYSDARIDDDGMKEALTNQEYTSNEEDNHNLVICLLLPKCSDIFPEKDPAV